MADRVHRSLGLGYTKPAVAESDLDLYDIVYVSGSSDDRVFKVDTATSTTARAAGQLFICTRATVAGGTTDIHPGPIVIPGNMTGYGANVYLDASGNISSTAAANSRVVGTPVGTEWWVFMGSLQATQVVTDTGAVTVSSSPYTVTTEGALIITTAGATIALPAGDDHPTGKLTIKDATSSASSSPHTISPDGSETIDGSASFNIASDYGALQLLFLGTTWHIV